MVLEACGATVETLSSIPQSKGCIAVDCCLFNSVTLPPRVTSVPLHVSRMMRFIDKTVPLLDLAWAHQCIIQRHLLPFKGDDRYYVSLEGDISSACQIFSIKSNGKRYEVGDLVQFSRGRQITSRGRVLSIIWRRQEKDCQLVVQLLVRVLLFHYVHLTEKISYLFIIHCVHRIL